MSQIANRQTPAGYAGIRWMVNILENLAIEAYSDHVVQYDPVLEVLRRAARELAGIRDRHAYPQAPAGDEAGAGPKAVYASPSYVAYGNSPGGSSGGSYTSDCPWQVCEDGSCRPACEIVIKVT